MTLARKISSYVPSKKKTETKSSSINKKLFPFKFLSFFASKRDVKVSSKTCKVGWVIFGSFVQA